MGIHRIWHLLARLAAVLAAAIAGTGLQGLGHSPAGAGQPLADWTVYHGEAAGSGVAATTTSFGSGPALTPAWTSPALDGEVFGEPLEAFGRVFVATEDDSVYALAADSGAVLWRTHLATPVPVADLACRGDITPTVGITGTPVIDTGRGEIFAVADELVDHAPSHVLVGLDVFTGAVMTTRPVDPPGAAPKALLQRTGLNLDDGRVVFGFGGNSGDCGAYHGWVNAVPETGGGTILRYEVDPTPGDREGAVWMGGAAPEVDPTGDVWAAAGNGSVATRTKPYDDSDSVFELSPTLGAPPEQYFAPTNWRTQNGGDQDLGSTAPALLGDGTVLQVGKSFTADLLTAAHLGGIDGQLTTTPACTGNDADGGDAVDATTAYVPCDNGVTRIDTQKSPPSVTVAWTAATGESGPPILAAGLVWSIGNGSVYGIDPATGATVTQGTVGSEANHFPTPSVADGLLLAPGGTTGDQVVAFQGSSGLPPAPTPAPQGTGTPPATTGYDLVGGDGGVFVFNPAGAMPRGFYGSLPGLGIVPVQPVVGIVATKDDGGYFLVTATGGVFGFGDAPYLGSTYQLTKATPPGGANAVTPAAPIVGIEAADTDRGYFLVGRDGGVFAFGTVPYSGSLPGRGEQVDDIVGIAATPDGSGYWVVAATGSVSAFGTAHAFASPPVTAPVDAIAGTPTGGGYWLATVRGGVYEYGNARAFAEGTLPALGVHPALGVAGIVPTSGTRGYWLIGADGGVFAFGTAPYVGSLPGLGVQVVDVVGAVAN